MTALEELVATAERWVAEHVEEATFASAPPPSYIEYAALVKRAREELRELGI